MGLLDRIQSATETRAQQIARETPAHVIDGWLAGARANGDVAEARVYQRALEIHEADKPRPRFPARDLTGYVR